ncbi:MerR family transcriptional regulator [Streptomyces sp. SID4919]|uniref:MerR family transcriptional regulator n=1 Tax=unclassified Streptomyces TaxID=2593676 RepID=UPI000823A40B|nr:MULTISPECIES: MerR family transcriptional regulator [unclassified Streptomyces]MYY11599.1 MerR family transcriptional regulator [Streptomyces sp. SID4919]SCK40735.1 Predicted transcriptional regulators [Streptomyces sp. AmelKG-E11A]
MPHRTPSPPASRRTARPSTTITVTSADPAPISAAVTGDGGPAAVPDTPYGAALTTGAVARRLGVAPTTLRSWDRRYGIGPVHHEGAKHRRWTPADIAVLETMCRLTAAGVPPAEAARTARSAAVAPSGPPGAVAAAPAEAPTGSDAPPDGSADGPARRPARPGNWGALPLGRVRPECRGLARAAVRLDSGAVDALLGEVLAAHGLVTAWDEVMMPALRAVGRKWETSGERYVEVEHLLSWHISSALRRVPARPVPSQPGPPVVVACAPGELHTLPLEALTAGLAERGVPVRMFGAAVPADALDEAVRRAGPAAVVLWSQSRTTACRALVRRVGGMTWGVRGARTRATVMAAGPGWAGAPVEGAVQPASLGEALRILGALYGRDLPE